MPKKAETIENTRKTADILIGAACQSLETTYVSGDFSFSAKNQDRLRPLPFLKEAGGLYFVKIWMSHAGETLSMKEAFETFAVAQTAKDISDKSLEGTGKNKFSGMVDDSSQTVVAPLPPKQG